MIMTRDNYRRMMQQITVSPGAETALLRKMASPPRRFPIKRILAAGVCAFLLAGGAAAAGLYSQYRGGSMTVSPTENSCRVSAEVSRFPLETFGTSLTEDLADGSLRRTFTDRTALEAYLGMPLVYNPILAEAHSVETLEDAIRYGWNLYPPLTEYPRDRYVLSAIRQEDSAPTAFTVHSHRVVKNIEVYCTAHIFTEFAEHTEITEDFCSGPGILSTLLQYGDTSVPVWGTIHYDSADYRFESESYTMKNGCTALVVTAVLTDPNGQDVFREYVGFFLLDGILYSVRPYAVYDPDVPTSVQTDEDMLPFLRSLLDTFV